MELFPGKIKVKKKKSAAFVRLVISNAAYEVLEQSLYEYLRLFGENSSSLHSFIYHLLFCASPGLFLFSFYIS